VELGTVEILLQELLHLRVGDVLRLNRWVDEELLVTVDRQAKFWGRPGVQGRNLAVQITRVIEKPRLDKRGHQG
jgi:flagellar motor switch protein FliM